MIRSYIVIVRKPSCELNKFCVNRILGENLVPENIFKTPCGVPSKVVIPLLLINCFSNCLWGCLVIFLLCITLCPSCFAIILMVKREPDVLL